MLKEGEELKALLKVTPEEMLVRWINYHLKAAEAGFVVANLGKDLKDSKALIYVMNQLDNSKCSLEALGEEDELKRA